ncbi:calaxin [Drosophila kikkawai]|uniref:Calaxin n=1 Tax=Drosophila kikkawai TaxID=30033 RepID=A0A6P4J5T8_DROKI|nr:EF-hand calcium-binding domain-containing protein 1 [Drosophila kikkawai]
MKLDFTMNDRHNLRFQALYGALVPQIARQVPFTEPEVSCLLLIYYKYSLQNGPTSRQITNTQFGKIVIGFQQLYDMDAVDRIVTLITGDRKYVKPMEFIQFMTIIMTRDIERKMEFAYMVYDKFDLGINREIISNAVEKFFPGDDDEVLEMRLDMVEFLILKFDEDQDGVITFEEYKSVVMHQPHLLEFLGPIFPSDDIRQVIAYCTAIYSHIPELSSM